MDDEPTLWGSVDRRAIEIARRMPWVPNRTSADFLEVVEESLATLSNLRSIAAADPEELAEEMETLGDDALGFALFIMLAWPDDAVEWTRRG